MKTKKEAIEFCKAFPDIYEDHPFRDSDWTLMRHTSNKKTFAAIFSRMGNIWINVKCEPNAAFFWRENFASVIPAYHMNKEHWNSIILDGSVPEADIKLMISESFGLTL